MWRVRMRLADACASRDLSLCGKWHIRRWSVTPWYVRHEAFMRKIWCVRTLNTTHSCAKYDSFVYTRHDRFMCVIWIRKEQRTSVPMTLHEFVCVCVSVCVWVCVSHIWVCTRASVCTSEFRHTRANVSDPRVNTYKRKRKIVPNVSRSICTCCSVFSAIKFRIWLLKRSISAWISNVLACAAISMSRIAVVATAIWECSSCWIATARCVLSWCVATPLFSSVLSTCSWYGWRVCGRGGVCESAKVCGCVVAMKPWKNCEEMPLLSLANIH